jgi:hypothetical protein
MFSLVEYRARRQSGCFALSLMAVLAMQALAANAQAREYSLQELKTIQFDPGSHPFSFQGAPGFASTREPTAPEHALGIDGIVSYHIGEPGSGREIIYWHFASRERIQRAARDIAFAKANLPPRGPRQVETLVVDYHGENDVFILRNVQCLHGIDPAWGRLAVRCSYFDFDDAILIQAEATSLDRPPEGADTPQNRISDPLETLSAAFVALAAQAADRPAEVAEAAPALKALAAVDLDSVAGFMPRFGRRASPEQGDIGKAGRNDLLGRVIYPFAGADDGAQARGLEFWVFSDSAAASDAEFDDDFWLNLMELPRGGEGEEKSFTISHTAGGVETTIDDIYCAGAQVPADVAYELRCAYRLDASPVVAVAFSYGAEAGFDDVETQINEDVVNALFGALKALAAAGLGKLPN